MSLSKYWVGSCGDNPEQIMFNEIDAFVSGYEYLDVFDETGERIDCYMFVKNEYVRDWDDEN